MDDGTVVEELSLGDYFEMVLTSPTGNVEATYTAQ